MSRERPEPAELLKIATQEPTLDVVTSIWAGALGGAVRFIWSFTREGTDPDAFAAEITSSVAGMLRDLARGEATVQ